jgi:hypothetical protein
MRIIANTTELDGMLRRVIGRLEQPEQALRAAGNLIYSLTLGAFDLSIGQRPAAWPPRRDGTVSKGRWFGTGPGALLYLRTAGTPSLPWDLVGGAQSPVPDILADREDAVPPSLSEFERVFSDWLALQVRRRPRGSAFLTDGRDAVPPVGPRGRGTVRCARYSCGPRGRGPSQPVGARKGAL